MNSINLVQPDSVPSFAIGFRRLWSPFHDIQSEVLKELNQAQKKIRVSMYGFTLAPLVDILIAKHQAGLDIKVLLDLSQSKGTAEAPQVKRLQDAGVDVVIGKSPVSGQILHEKCFSIDDKRTISGSWNSSLSAQKQFNHCDFIWSKDLVDVFNQVFDYLRELVIEEEKK
ncbi:MAG: hypothetical protein KGI08_10960 [Thaumarchaeota archaeon]|nr:hypothetical protein [Nitrososphaerota archaeon]